MDDRERGEHGEPMELVVPFVVCRSQGGPFEDEAFVAGFQAGALDATLKAAAGLEASRVAPGFPVRTALLPLVELLAMSRGFPSVVVREVGGGPGYGALLEWSMVTFLAPGEEWRR
jgi:hypothetical protein